MTKVRVGIFGGAGYTGGELIRLLLRHNAAEIVFVQSRSQARKPVASIHQDMIGDTELHFEAQPVLDVHIVFLCLGHGESRPMLKELALPPHIKVIDLSADFRPSSSHSSSHPSSNPTDGFIYGLPEFNKEAIKSASKIANPGCFATALQLALLPAAQAGILGRVHTTGITGSTGAGQGLAATSHFSWRTNNIQPYKTLEHQHLAEVGYTLLQASPTNQPPEIDFVPWRGDFARGIFTTSVFDSVPDTDYAELYRTFYQPHPFTHVSSQMIDLKQVLGTNKCLLHIEQKNGRIVVHSAIDNLLKGASGQAIQNMNLLFGLPETEGLMLKATAF